MLIMCYHIMYVTCMDLVDRRRSEKLAMHASVGRERRQKMEAEGLVPKRRVEGHVVLADDEPQL